MWLLLLIKNVVDVAGFVTLKPNSEEARPVLRGTNIMTVLPKTFSAGQILEEWKELHLAETVCTS